MISSSPECLTGISSRSASCSIRRSFLSKLSRSNSSWTRTERVSIWRISGEHSDRLHNVWDACVWTVCRPLGKAGALDDVWIDAPDSGLPDDGLYQRVTVRAHGDDGRGVLVGPGGDVAVRGLYRRSV